MKPRLIVIAGNVYQWKDYLHKKDLHWTQTLYISDAYKLQGYRDLKVVKVGTWYNQSSELLGLLEAKIGRGDLTEIAP